MSEYPSYLIHYGIEGQKWGVRRFQNEDGTYTDDGLLRRKEQKHFVKEQNRTNKKFDKLTDKIQARQAAGKKVSDKTIEKAVKLGTKHRSLDYISQNPRPYLNARGLNKASKARNTIGVSSGAMLTGIGAASTITNTLDAYDNYNLLFTGASSIGQSIAHRKVEKMFLNKWMERQYGKALDESRNLTIKDLEKHGIKFKNRTYKDNEKYRKKYKMF